MGTTGGGENGYGSFLESDSSAQSVALTIIGTWRNRLDSPYYWQFSFGLDGSCELWITEDVPPVHAAGTYTIDNHNGLNHLHLMLEGIGSHYYYFFFRDGDLWLYDEQSTRVYYRVT